MSASAHGTFEVFIGGLKRWITQRHDDTGRGIERSSTEAYFIASDQMEFEMLLADMDAFEATFKSAKPPIAASEPSEAVRA